MCTPGESFPYTTWPPCDALNATIHDTNTNYYRNEDVADIEVAIMATILALAIFGNGIVVISLNVKRGKLSRMHLMILHLSLADLFVAFFNVLPQMVWDITYRFQGGAFLCGAVKYLQLVAMYASSYVLLSTAIDRYVAICHPFTSQQWSSKQAHLLVLAAWIASLLFSIPQVFIFSMSEVEDGSGVFDCWASFQPEWTLTVYITWTTVSVFVIPTLMLGVLYGYITCAVWTSSKMMQKLTPNFAPPPLETAAEHGNSFCKGGKFQDEGFQSGFHFESRNCTESHVLASNEATGGVADLTHNAKRTVEMRRSVSNDSMKNCHSREGRGHNSVDGGISRAKIKTVKMTITVIICYLFCWAPFFVAQMWAVYDANVQYETTFFTIVLLLANLNSCTNPWIYMVFSDTICNNLRGLVRNVAYRLTGGFCSWSGHWSSSKYHYRSTSNGKNRSTLRTDI